ncbi:MAG: lycopene cyclase domain-containing protein [Bacteroidales bacterium]
MSLYFILLIGSIAVPLLLSFDKKLQFYKQWKFVLPSIAIVAAFYIICDIYLTRAGVWGFNPRYHSDILLIGLPVEEWLFFIIIPYASIFLHEAFILYFPKIQLNNKLSQTITIIFIVILILLAVFNLSKTYTVYASALMIFSLILSLLGKSSILKSFYITFLLILIPFLIVNSILTGSFIESEVVWYNNNENLGIRLFTIPVEDFAYGFSMILFNLLLINKLKKVLKPKQLSN